MNLRLPGRLIDLVGTVAPSIASAMGSPLAGVAIRELSRAVLGDPDGDAAALEAQLAAADPETLARIKEADAQFRTQMRQLDVNLEGIHAADRANARDLARTSGATTNTVLSAVILAGFFALTFAVWWRPPATGSGEIVYMMLGVVGTMAMAVVTFHFGSSIGSKQKTALLGDARPRIDGRLSPPSDLQMPRGFTRHLEEGDSR